ncbi:2OG-Fe(II) oxygenase [Frigidibacter sp. MR17.14]|uniref:HalD/BesD family halogenase n=1 Tax=Frigidibacter sp. MR17.14 TaxID=3126509 RepID=UPI0030131D73
MDQIIDLDRYPLDRPGSPDWLALVDNARAEIAASGMANLPGFLRPAALAQALAEIVPVMDRLAFVHRRAHNVYFTDSVAGLSPDHPALAKVETINHTVCWDQIPTSVPAWVYDWPPLAVFLAAVLGKSALFPMRDALARMNVMKYGHGEALNWHFDRSEFTTTLLLQEPSGGGRNEYRANLRSAADPNHDGVAAALEGRDPEVKSFAMAAGTLNIFLGRDTLHRVTRCEGERARYIAVFSYYDRPAVCFTKEEQVGFYGRAA